MVAGARSSRRAIWAIDQPCWRWCWASRTLRRRVSRRPAGVRSAVGAFAAWAIVEVLPAPPAAACRRRRSASARAGPGGVARHADGAPPCSGTAAAWVVSSSPQRRVLEWIGRLVALGLQPQSSEHDCRRGLLTERLAWPLRRRP